MEAVRGIRGYWHATEGEWTGCRGHIDSKLAVLCRGETEGIGPNERSIDTRKVDCPRCLKALGRKQIKMS